MDLSNYAERLSAMTSPLKKAHLLRCAQSARSNVLLKYASARGLIARLAPGTFLTGLGNLSNERGVALVLVLWIFIFLFVVAFDFSAAVREDGMIAHRYAEETEGYYLALAGFEEGLYSLLKMPATQPQASGAVNLLMQAQETVDGTWRERSLGTSLYKVRLVDEAGKINLNRVDEETLRRIFTNLAVEEPRRSILVDSILDWRDEDDLHRTNGAENDYYLSLSPPYTARDGPFDAVEDLLWVRGVTPELLYGLEGEVALRDIFSVDSPIVQVNLRTAPAEVIHALFGISLEKSRASVEERKKLSEQAMRDLLQLYGIAAGDAALRQIAFVAPTVITVEAVGYQAESTPRRQVRGVVRIGGQGQALQLVRWVDRDIIQGKVQNAN